VSETSANTILILQNALSGAKCRFSDAAQQHAGFLTNTRLKAQEMVREAATIRDLSRLLRDADPANAEKYADLPGQEDLDQRAAVIAGLRELVDTLEMQPDAPVLQLRRLVVYGGGEDAATDEAEVSRYATALGVTAVRDHPAFHFEVTKAFGPGGAVKVQLISTKGSNLKWKLGDPIPGGVPADVVARYGKKWHEANPGDERCPYWVACDVCMERDPFGADDEPPGGDAAVALLDAEQEAYREAAAADETEVDDTEAERALDAYMASYPTDGEDGGA
jgi:hypothetical protein